MEKSVRFCGVSTALLRAAQTRRQPKRCAAQLAGRVISNACDDWWAESRICEPAAPRSTATFYWGQRISAHASTRRRTAPRTQSTHRSVRGDALRALHRHS